MAIPSFFKQNKPREFNFIPRYYDPEKEAREERLKRIKLEMGIREEGDTYVPGIKRGSMSNYFRQKDKRVEKFITIRLVVIVLVLILITYFYLYF